MKKAVLWLHEGDEEPTFYPSIASLARVLGCSTPTAWRHVQNGILSDKALNEEKKMRYNKQGFTYQGREYESLTEFQKVHECGRKLAERARRGDDITASLAKKTAKSVHSSFLEKASKAQELANRALKGAK